MTHKLRLQPSDRLVINGQSFRCVEITSQGCVFVAQDDPQNCIEINFERLRELLKQNNTHLDRAYYTRSDATNRLENPQYQISDLPLDMQSLVIWRHKFVCGFLKLESKKETARTPPKTKFAITILHEEICATEQRISDLTPKRAGQVRSVTRDAPSASSLLWWVRRYEASGCSIRALIPRTYQNGRKGFRLPLESELIVKETIQHYASFQRPTKASSVHHCMTKFKKINKERKDAGLEPLVVPSGRTVLRRIRGLDPYTTYAKRYGVEAANRKFTLIEEGIEASFPMQRIEIDEWKVDVLTLLDLLELHTNLSDKEAKEYAQQRLWLNLAIDCATRCVLALHLSEQPSTADAIATLSLMTRDKSDLARQSGCTSSWHHCGGLGEIFVDQGSAYVGTGFMSAALDLGGTLAKPPAGNPSLRARVERIFRSFSTQVMPLLAGRTFSNAQERGDYPSEALAVHTPDSLQRCLTLHVVDRYHNSPHQGLNGETPNNCWNRLCQEKGALPPPSAHQWCSVLGIADTRVLSNRGLRVCGIDYASPDLHELFKRAYRIRLKIKVNPLDLGWILYWHEDRWKVANAIQRSFKGISLGVWRLASRELQLRYKHEAQLHEDDVSGAIEKIREINQEQLDAFNAKVPKLTTEDLLREERRLHVGLRIEPEQHSELLSLSAHNELGVEVPIPQINTSLIDIVDQEPPDNPSMHTHDQGQHSATEAPKGWGMEEDE